ncbi:hypothetical protein [Burkholderia metallica]|uniref:hypothetical protein n=1 Tax=Burkholderia metallica TaxID=488729 RepID=UPI00131C6471|nr:hypothetical protein [Burkholderia metallica]
MVEILPRMRHLFDGSAIFPAQASALKQSQTNLNVLVVALPAGTIAMRVAMPALPA